MSVHPGSIWIDNHFQNVPIGLWVAANANRQVAEDYDYDKLIAFLQSQNIPLQTLTIAYIPAGTYQ